MFILRRAAASILATLMIVTVVTPAASAADVEGLATPGTIARAESADGASAALWVGADAWAGGQLSVAVESVIPSPSGTVSEIYRVGFTTRGGDTITDVHPRMDAGQMVAAGLTVSIPLDAAHVGATARPVIAQWHGDAWTELPTAYDAGEGVAWTEAASTGVFAVIAKPRGDNDLPVVAIDLSNPDASALWDGTVVGEHDVTVEVAQQLATYLESVCAADAVVLGADGLAMSGELRREALALLSPDMVVSVEAGSDSGFMSGSETTGGPVVRANAAAAELAEVAAEQLTAHTGRAVTVSEAAPDVEFGEVPSLTVNVGLLDHNYDRPVLERRPDLYALALAKSVMATLGDQAGTCVEPGMTAPRMSGLDVSRLKQLVRAGSWAGGEETLSFTYAGYTITGSFSVEQYPASSESGTVAVRAAWSGLPPADHPFWTSTGWLSTWMTEYFAVSLDLDGDKAALYPRQQPLTDISDPNKHVFQGIDESWVYFVVPPDWDRNIHIGSTLVWTAPGATPGTPGGGPPPVPPLPSQPTAELLALFESFGISNEYLYGADPVNLSTGAMAHTEETFALTGLGDQVIDLTLNFSGGDTRLSQLGRGWNFEYGSRAQLYENGSVLVTRADGSGLFFESDGADGYQATPGARASLDAITGGVRLTQHDGTSKEFIIDGDTGFGVLSAMEDRQGNALTFEYGSLVEGSDDEPTFAPLESITDEAGQTVVVESTSKGRIKAFVHPDGRRWELSYDGNNLVKIKDGAGRERHFEYDSKHRLVKVTGADGVVEVDNTYDSEDRVASQTDGVGSLRTFAYDGDGNTTVTDSLGHESVIEHNDEGFAARSTDAEGGVTRTEYDADRNPSKSIDARGNSHVSTYDSKGRVLTFTNAVGEKTTYTYNSTGDLTKIVAPAPNGESATTTFVLNDDGRAVETHYPDGTVSHATYNKYGDTLSVTDAEGNVTGFTYDARGNVVKVVDAEDNETVSTYDIANRLLTSTDGRGATTTHVWDAADNLLSVTDGEGAKTVFTYDVNGSLKKERDPLGRETTYEYNANLQVTATHFPDGTVERQKYDTEHRLTKRTNADGTEVDFTYDGLGRQTVMSDEADQTWVTGYDKTGNPVSQKDPALRTVKTEFDELGRPTKVTDALGNTTRTEYAPGGEVAATVDQLGKRTEYTYDVAGRLTEVTAPDGTSVAYSHDDNGNVTALVDARGFTTAYKYDGLNRQVLMTDALGGKWTTKFDAAGNVVEVKDPRGAITATTFDLVGRPVTMKDAEGHTTKNTFDAAGQLLKTVDPLGRTTSFTYDPMGRVKKTTAPDDSTALFVYDAMGRTTKATDARGKHTVFAYDALGRETIRTDAAGGKWRTEYDVQGNTTKTIDALGRATTVEYDAAYRQTAVVDALGNRTETDLDKRGTVIESCDALGRATTFTVDLMGRVTSSEAPDGGVTAYEYDAAGNVVEVKDPRGFTTTTTYDKLNRPVRVVDAEDGAWVTEFDKVGNPTATIDALGHKTSTAYDLMNRPTVVTDAAGGKTRTTYDAAGQVVKVTDALDRETALAYDLMGRVTQTTHADDSTESFTYYATGETKSHEDQRGNVTAFVVDDLGREISRTDAAGEVWATEYDKVGNVLATVDPLGGRTEATFDKLNRPVVSTDAEGAKTHTTYTPVGTVESVKDPLGHETGYAYDSMNRPVMETSADGAVTAYTYDLAGNQVEVTDPRGVTTTTAYDKLNRPVRVVDGEDGVWVTEFDKVGNPTAVVDPLGHRTVTGYDVVNRATVVTDAAGGKTRTTYDAAGQVAKTTDALDRNTVLTYDQMGQVTEVTHPDGTKETLEYFATGETKSHKDQRGNITEFEVDALGRETTRTDTAGEVWVTEYDKVGNVLATVDPLGGRTETAFDKVNRPVVSTDAEGAKTHTTYTPVGTVASVKDPLGEVTEYVYDVMNRPVTETSPEGAVTEYAYDAAGNRVSVTNARGFTLTTVFDGLNRAVKVTDPDGGVTTTGYDPLGRTTSVRDANGDTTKAVYDALGRTTKSVDGEGFATVMSYDAVGNMLTETSPRGGVTSYVFDVMNRPVKVTSAEGETTSMVYDGAGNVVKSVNAEGIATTYTYDPRQLLTRTVENAVADADAGADTNVTTKVAYDARGVVVATTDARGNTTKYGVDALGRTVESTDTLGRVTGTVFDQRGQMTAELHADGTETVHTYSADGHQLSTKYTDRTVTYKVDKLGNRTSMKDQLGTSTWKFDWANRVISDTDAKGNTHTYTYDAVGNQTQAALSDGRVLDRVFDGRGLAVSQKAISQDGSDGVTEFGYDADGNLTEIARPSGVVTTTSFDLVGRVTTIAHSGNVPEGFEGDPADAPHAPGNAYGHCNEAPGHVNQEPTGCWTNDLELAYEYDERGLITARAVATDAAVTETAYEHDALGRLTESVTEGVTSTYGWDAASNLVSESVTDDVTTSLADDGWEVTRTVNDVNQLTTVVTDVRLPAVHTTTETFDYDERGNRTGSVTKRTTGGKTHTLARVDYRFDAMDQVTHVRDHGDNLNNAKDDTVTGWARDGLGRALSVTENDGTKQRVFDGTALVVDGDTRITRAPNGAVLSEAFETIEGKGKNATTVTVSREVLNDVLNSAVAVAEDGVIDADLVFYTDFGEELFTPERVTVTGFTGRSDAASLVEFETRVLDPASRVWVQEDVYAGTVTRASSMNRYAYVEGAPETYVDAFGMYRAASAVAAQTLSAADYAVFMEWFAILALRGFKDERPGQVYDTLPDGAYWPGCELLFNGKWWCKSAGETFFPGNDLESQVYRGLVDGAVDTAWSTAYALTPEGWKAMLGAYNDATDKDGYLKGTAELFVHQPIAEFEQRLTTLMCPTKIGSCASSGGLEGWGYALGQTGTETAIAGTTAIIGAGGIGAATARTTIRNATPEGSPLKPPVANSATSSSTRFIVNSSGEVLDTTRVSIPSGKFDYLLKNPSKSGVFSDSMGFDQAGLDSALRNHLTGNFGTTSPSVSMTGGGTKFTVRGPVTGPSGQTWQITTAWGVDANGTIRLITATP